MTSTFAPPTGPPVTHLSSEPRGEFEPADAPRGRRRSVALAVAVLGVVALGIGALVALTGDTSNRGDVAEPYSLIAAAETAIGARTVEFDLSVSAAELAEVTVSGAVDNESQLVSVTTDLSSLLALGDVPMPLGDGGEVALLLDGANGVVYLDASMLGGFLPSDAAWVSIDLGVLAEQGGESLDDLQGDFGFDPSQIAQSLLDADTVTEVGVETIDGVEVKRFRVDVDITAALAAVPQADLDAQLGDIELPDTVGYDVWVTADNQLRRVTFGTEIAGQPISMQLDMTTSNDALGLELPAESDVVDLTALLGF
jgi:hypothetical protein